MPNQDKTITFGLTQSFNVPRAQLSRPPAMQQERQAVEHSQPPAIEQGSEEQEVPPHYKPCQCVTFRQNFKSTFMEG